LAVTADDQNDSPSFKMGQQWLLESGRDRAWRKL